MFSSLSTARVFAAAAASLVLLGAAAPASATPKPKVQLSGGGTYSVAGDGHADVTGAVTGTPFGGALTATVVTASGTLPEPGVCIDATVNVVVDDGARAHAEYASAGRMCGNWVQLPTSAVTHTYTGRYDVTSSTKRGTVGTDGWIGLRFGITGSAGIELIDT